MRCWTPSHTRHCTKSPSEFLPAGFLLVEHLGLIPYIECPAITHPFRFPDRAIERRNWVIDRMQENGFVNAEDAEAARLYARDLFLRTADIAARKVVTNYRLERW